MAGNINIAKPEGGTLAVRQEVAREVNLTSERAVAAAAEQVRAEIHAMHAIAMQFPRDIDVFREGILKDCRRPGFAASALYHRPQGRKFNEETKRWESNIITGFSIRFAESASRHFMHMRIVSRINYDDDERSGLTVYVLDVQSNTGYSTDATLHKVVERKEVKSGRTILGRRENTYGDMVYLVPATPDEFRSVMGVERSKLVRDNILRLLPADILEECRAQIDATVNTENAKDPDSAKKKILDKFAALGVSASMLKEYLGRPLEGLTVKDIGELTNIHNGLKDGQFTWADLVRVEKEPAEGEEPPPKQGKLRDKIMGQPQAAEPQSDQPKK